MTPHRHRQLIMGETWGLPLFDDTPVPTTLPAPGQLHEIPPEAGQTAGWCIRCLAPHPTEVLDGRPLCRDCWDIMAPGRYVITLTVTDCDDDGEPVAGSPHHKMWDYEDAVDYGERRAAQMHVELVIDASPD